MEKIIEIKNISKKFGKNEVFSNINIDIIKGEIYALVGNNGAGKTTLLKIVCDLLQQNSGKIVLEKNCRLGCLIESPGVFGDMNAFQNLKAKALSIGFKCKKEYIYDLLKQVGLENVGKKLVAKFSTGMRQRLGIALALLGNPDVLILDEPINGLDPQGILEIRELLMKINKEKCATMIISSHILDELMKIATWFCFLNNGQIIKNISKTELIKEANKMPIDEYYLKVIEKKS